MKRFMFPGILLTSLLFLNSIQGRANITLPKIFTSNMVLQRDKPISIWGWAAKGESITVKFNGQQQKVKTDKTGKWTVQLKPMPFSNSPLVMNIEGKNKISLVNILIGDVYICSGQSNMEWVLRDTKNAAKEIADATHEGIRMFTVPKATSFVPTNDLEGGRWEESNPKNATNFSAVAYFFGRKLNKDLNIPIGLINSSWGGTNVQAWISWDIMGKNDAYKGVDFSEMEKDREGRKERQRQFREALAHDKGSVEKWYEQPADNTWKNYDMPKAWEQSEIGIADGIVWFRKEFDLPADFKAGKTSLSLGPIDDIDITYVNGKEVGTTNVWNADRVYPVDATLLKPGKNSIVIKVTDTGGGGGLFGKADQLFIEIDGKKIPLAGLWSYKTDVINTAFNIQNDLPNAFPSQLYNAMIAPIINYAICGGIWYQGEANAGESYKYRTLFPEMISDWRNKWHIDFPFYWVQLANFMEPDAQPMESGWAELREAQSMTLSLPKTGQAVIIDIGEAGDIHPRNKQDVGYRLALAAEKVSYGKDIVYSGPTYQSMKTEGNKIVINFGNTGSGLLAKDRDGYVKGFVIAGADKKFVWATAVVRGNSVLVSSDSIANPVAVRYAWANNPVDANLYNKEGLPASPFRTDDWPGVTMGKSDYK